MRQEAHTRRKKHKEPGRSPLDIGIEILAIVALLVLALFVPQIIFRVQDTILCSSITLGARENVDVEALSAAYERSLYKRLLNFTEGKSAGDQFYVTAQDLELTNEVYEYLESREGFEAIAVFFELNLLPMIFWERTYEVTQWKQYVIYSDDYAKGVNFILWYIELQVESGTRMMLLADAETGTIYAVKTCDCSELFYNSDGNYLYSYYWMEEAAPAFWYYFCRYYEAMSDEESQGYIEKWTEEYETDASVDIQMKESVNDSAIPHSAEAGDWMENAGYRLEDQQMRFLLPYGATSLEVLLQVGELKSDSKFIYYHPDVSVGIRQIYELIPEFA